MSEKTALTIQILEKLGAPLLSAIVARSGDKDRPGEDDARATKEAELVAGLLSRSVKTALSLSQPMIVGNKEADTDSVRLALTGISSSLLGAYYRQSGKMPNDEEIRRMVTALEAVLKFAENFSLASDGVLRLEATDPDRFFSDENQITIQCINVFAPLVGAMAEYSFGRQANKLLQEVSDRLIKGSQNIRASIIDVGDDKLLRKYELQILKGLVAVYVECHLAETSRIMGMSEKERETLKSMDDSVSMDHLWKDFGLRLSMMQALAKNIMPENAAIPASVQVQQAPPKGPETAAETPVSQPEKIKEPEAELEEEEGAPKDDGAYNPMSFFSAPKDSAGDEEGAA